MATVELTQTVPNAQLRNAVTLASMAALLFMRLPLETTLATLRLTPSWLGPIIEVSAYLITAFLIWWERDRLADYHIDALAIVLLLLFKPWETLIVREKVFLNRDLAFPAWPALAIWVIAGALLLALLASRPRTLRITGRSLLWLAAGIGAGIGLACVLVYPANKQLIPGPITDAMRSAYRSELSPARMVQRLWYIPYSAGFAAAYEEPIFRGFLWGYLRQKGWKNVWILLLQAGLFMLGHAYYLGRAPLSFWIVPSVGGLVLGLLAWRSRSIATTIAAHGVFNGAMPIIEQLFFGYVF